MRGKRIAGDRRTFLLSDSASHHRLSQQVQPSPTKFYPMLFTFILLLRLSECRSITSVRRLLDTPHRTFSCPICAKLKGSPVSFDRMLSSVLQVIYLLSRALVFSPRRSLVPNPST